MEVCNIVWEVVTKTIPKKNKCEKAKWLPEEAVKRAENKKSEQQTRKEKIYPMKCRLPENSMERKESLCK